MGKLGAALIVLAAGLTSLFGSSVPVRAADDGRGQTAAMVYRVAADLPAGAELSMTCPAESAVGQVHDMVVLRVELEDGSVYRNILATTIGQPVGGGVRAPSAEVDARVPRISMATGLGEATLTIHGSAPARVEAVVALWQPNAYACTATLDGGPWAAEALPAESARILFAEDFDGIGARVGYVADVSEGSYVYEASGSVTAAMGDNGQGLKSYSITAPDSTTTSGANPLVLGGAPGTWTFATSTETVNNMTPMLWLLDVAD